LQAAMHETRAQIELPEAVRHATAHNIHPDAVEREHDQRPAGIILEDLPYEIGTLLRQLRILCALKVSLLREREQGLCQSYSNLSWKLEHSILDRDESESWEIELVTRLVGTTVLIMSYFKLRDLAAPILYQRLSSRLQTQYTMLLSTLEGTGDRDLSEAELAVWLWSLCLGWRASWTSADSRIFFIDELARLCLRCGISTGEDVRDRVLSVIPQAHTLMDISESLWGQVEDKIWFEMLAMQDDLELGDM
jgi:hypothetical protein